MFFNKSAKLLQQAERELLTVQTELQETRESLIQSKTQQEATSSQLSQAFRELEALGQSQQELLSKYSPILDLDEAIEQKKTALEVAKSNLQELNDKYRTGLSVMSSLDKKIALYKESLDLTEYGLYVQKYNFEFPEQYKVELESVYQR